MAHPDLGVSRHARKQGVGGEHVAGCPTILPGLRLPHGAAQCLACQLHAVADAEHGDAEAKNARITLRGAGFVDARRPAREDDALGVEFADPVGRDVVPHDLAIHILLPHPAGDELGILRPEIEHEHAL